MTDLLQFTINARKSHRQPQCTLHLVCEDRVFFFLLIFTSLYETAPKMRANGSSGLSIFILRTSHFIQPHKQNSNPSEKREGRTVSARFKYHYHGKNLASDKFWYELFFLKPIHTITTQNTELSY
jgi:hypothetical protein